MRALVCSFVALACAKPIDEYRCLSAAQCREGSASGFCETTGYCSFVDDGCPTGRRYGGLAGQGLADACVPLPTCGDGLVRPEVEECDDGNDDDEDGCTRVCVACTDEADARFVWPDNGHCYTRHEAASPREDARWACIDLGAHLSVHETRAENAAVAAALGAGTPAWFGLEDTTTWLNGAPVQYSEWASGCPGAGADLDFVLQPGGQWCDAVDDAPHLCEHEPRWLVRPEDGHAYTLLPETTTQPVGAARCAALGGHLADLTSSEEEVFIGPLIPFGAWIGLSDTAVEGTFVWSDGGPLDYVQWGFDEPSDLPDEDCVYMYTVGDWRDVSCDISYYYALCEREL